MKRSTVNLWLSGVAAVALGAAVGAQIPRQPAPPAPQMPVFGVYEGASVSGNFQEALDEAVARAVRAEVNSGTVRYQLTRVEGELGPSGSQALRVQVQVSRPDRTPMKSTSR